MVGREAPGRARLKPSARRRREIAAEAATNARDAGGPAGEVISSCR
jgi:hypothetical protein